MARERPRKPDRLHDEYDRLRRRGVPYAYIDEILGRRESWISDSSGLVFIPLLVAVVAIVLLVLLGVIADSMRIAATGAAKEKAWVYSADDLAGVAYIGAIFAGAFGFGWLREGLVEKVHPFPAPNAAASNLRDPGIGPTAFVSDWFLRRITRAAEKEASDADSFLRAVARRQGHALRLATLIIALPCLAIMAATHWTYWTAGPVGVTLHSPWSTRLLPWADAESLILGCNSTRDSEILIYKVSFAGRTFSLAQDGMFGFDNNQIEPSDVVARLELADVGLTTLPRKRWQSWNRNPMHPDCIAYWEAAAGEDGAARMAHLLRAP